MENPPIRCFSTRSVVCRALMVFSAVCALASPLGAAPLLLDNFNADTTGAAPVDWTTSTPSGTITVDATPSATDQSVKLSKTVSTNTISVARSFIPTTGKITVELKAMTPATAGFKSLPYIYSSGGAIAVSVAFNNGSIMSYVGGTLTTVQAFTASTWYTVRVELDTTTQTYNLLINGTQRLTGAAFRNTVTDVASLRCMIGDTYTGIAYFDTVSVFVPGVPAVSGSYLVAEDFNATATGGSPANWTLDASGGSAAVVAYPFVGDKSLRLTKSTTANQSTATMTFPPIGGQATFEIKAQTLDTTGYKNILTLTNGSTPGIQIGFNGNSITSYVGSTQTTLVVYDKHSAPAAAGAPPGAATPAGTDTLTYTITPGQWYVVRVVLDTAAGTYDLYLDGIKRLTAAALVNRVNNISTVTSGITGTNLGTLYVDNFLAFTTASMIGSPPAPVFDPLNYGAVADGLTVNTTAIQAAIDACAGSGGSVWLHGGTYVSGMVTVKSGMTFFVDRSATLLGSGSDADFPAQALPDPGNFAPQGIPKALIYLGGATNASITGGGTINGNGYNNAWWLNSGGSEVKRPVIIYPNNCANVSIQNLYLQDGAVWGVVPVETNYLIIKNVLLDSRAYGNRDGFDLTDCQHALVQDCTLNTDDDMICPKSGITSGLDDITYKNLYLMGSVRASGFKFGTASYGSLTNVTFQDVYMKNVSLAGMALESVDGAVINGVTFRRVELNHTNSPFFETIGTRGKTSTGYAAKIGTISNILYEDISATNLDASIGCPVSGLNNGTRYPLKNLFFRRCNLTFPGGVSTVPAEPGEMGGGYPECTQWGNLPAYAYFLRHADNVTFASCTNGLAATDARSVRFLDDVTGLIDAVPATANNLTVSKLQYSPAPPSASEQAAGYTSASSFQFVELLNVGTAYVDLSGVTLAAGASFTFTDDLSIHVLAPGQRMLIASNLAAFQRRYGAGLTVAGTFLNGTNLPAAGGRVQLSARDGSTIDDFNFLGTPSWPTSTNGGGPALVLIHPTAGLDLGNPANWRASSAANGAPGVDDALHYAAWAAAFFSNGGTGIGAPFADPDGDGFSNLTEYARGSNPLIGGPGDFPVVSIEPFQVGANTDSYSTVRFRYRPAAEDVLLAVVTSTDLQTWTTGGITFGSTVDQGDGTVVVTYRSVLPVAQEPQRYYRVAATYRP